MDLAMMEMRKKNPATAAQLCIWNISGETEKKDQRQTEAENGEAKGSEKSLVVGKSSDKSPPL